jgi:SPP1 gp7 family putative phage head morphogenesis protein
LVKGKLPFYAELTKDGISKTAKNVFQLIDTDALDFLVNFNMQLVGEVSRELADGINKTIQLGITSGKDVSGIVRDMGGVIKDKDAFRRAGKTVFKTAQNRMTLIARTEIIRAHNQGQIKFYDAVGVKKFIWQTAEDERTCPICQPLDGKTFVVGKDPGPPTHPDCRCWSVPVIPDNIKTTAQIEELVKRNKK